MFNFWRELEKFITNSYDLTMEERETLFFETLDGRVKICYKIAEYIYQDWKDWTIREKDFIEHFTKLEDYNRLLRDENSRLKNSEVFNLPLN